MERERQANKIVLVTGANGNVGKWTYHWLTRYSGIEVKCCYPKSHREPHERTTLPECDKVDLREDMCTNIDASDPETLRVLESAHCVFLVPPDSEDRVKMVDNMIKASKNATTLVLASFVLHDQLKNTKIGGQLQQIEDLVTRSEKNYVIVRFPLLLENQVLNMPTIKEQQKIMGPLDPAVKYPVISAKDLGEFCASVCVNAEQYPGQTFFVSAPEPISQQDLCNAYEKVLNTKLTYEQLDDRQAIQYMSKYVPQFHAEMLDEIYQDINKGNQQSLVRSDFKQVLGHEPSKPEAWITDHRALFA